MTVEEKCINCKHAGEQFNSAYDGRWLIKCNIQDGSKRPHESCEHFKVCFEEIITKAFEKLPDVSIISVVEKTTEGLK